MNKIKELVLANYFNWFLNFLVMPNFRETPALVNRCSFSLHDQGTAAGSETQTLMMIIYLLILLFNFFFYSTW